MAARWTSEQLAAETVRALTEAGLVANLIDEVARSDEPGAQVSIERFRGEEYVWVDWQCDRGVHRAGMAALWDLTQAEDSATAVPDDILDLVPEPTAAALTRTTTIADAMFQAILTILTNDGFVAADEGHYESRVRVRDWNGFRTALLSQAEFDARRAAHEEWETSREAPG
jgi:hypothetical protein